MYRILFKRPCKIGHWGVTLLEVEIGQFSMKTIYRLDEKYQDYRDFMDKNNWGICPTAIVLKDGTELVVLGTVSGQWDAENHLYISTYSSLNVILDPSQIAGMYFYDGYELNEEGCRVEKPDYYIPFE